MVLDFIRPVSAALPSQTVNYYSSTADGYLTNSTLPHATCTAGVAGTVTNTTTTSYVGQKMDNSSYTTVYPNAVGDYSNWTKSSGTYNYQMVDEVGEHDSDTTYVYSSANGYIDLYNVGTPTGSPDAWAQIVVTAVVRKVTDNSFMRIKIQTDGTVYSGSWQAVSSTSYDAGFKSETWALNPKYGYSWNITSLTALQVGIELNTTTPLVRCTQVYVDMYYCNPTIYRAAEYFDTSSIPDGATISAATMTLYVTTDKAETSFNILVLNSTSGTTPSTPLKTTDYKLSNYLASAGASFTMFGTSGAINIVFNATGLAMISKTGVTNLFIVSSRDKAGTVCGFQGTNDEEYAIFSSQEATTAVWRPWLQVTWSSESPQCIYADSFSSAEATWSVVGTSPYVDDSSVSYIQSFTATNESWFGFPDPTVLPSQIWLEVEAQAGAVATYCNITLEEGTVNTTIATVCFDRFTSWKSYNVTSILSTVAKLQAARVKFVSLNATTAFGNKIYRLRLRLYTGPVPLYSTLGVSTPEVNTTATFSCQWNGAVTASLTQNSTGSFVTTNATISSGWGNLTALLPTNSANTVLYWFNANDSSNIWERTENYTLNLMWPSYDSTAYNMVNSDTGSLAHSLGRQLFFDSVTNLYWIKYFYNNGSWYNLVWSFSSDGKAWTYGGIIRDNVNASGLVIGMGWGYWLLEQRGGVSYCHIQFGDEATSSHIYYRRGTLNVDGTISFVAWQTAVTCTAGDKICVEGFAISPSGHVWIGYEVGPATDWDHGYENITMSTATDGTWSTHASYPQKVNTNDGVICEGLVFSTGQDYYAIMVLNPSSNATVKHNVWSYEIQNNVLQSVVNASNSATYEARFYSVAKDVSGNLHLAYVNYTGAINYCKWNTTLWNVQDTNVGSSLLAGDPVGYPVISTHKTVNETYVNWVTGGDCWLNVYNGTSNAWRGLERMHGLTGQREYSDPNHVIEQVDQYVFFAFNIYNWTTARTEIWSYIYAVTLITHYSVDLSTGFSVTLTTDIILVAGLKNYTVDLDVDIDTLLAMIMHTGCNVIMPFSFTPMMISSQESDYNLDFDLPVSTSFNLDILHNIASINYILDLSLSVVTSLSQAIQTSFNNVLSLSVAPDFTLNILYTAYAGTDYVVDLSLSITTTLTTALQSAFNTLTSIAVNLGFSLNIPQTINPDIVHGGKTTVAFYVTENAEPVQNATILITEYYYGSYVANETTGINGRTEFWLKSGLYNYHIQYKEWNITGKVWHYDWDTVNIELANYPTDKPIDIGWTIKLAVPVGALLVLVGLLVVVAKKRRKW